MVVQSRSAAPLCWLAGEVVDLRVWASSLSCGNKAPDGECWVRLMSTVERRRWSDESRPLSSKGFPTTNGGWVSSDDYMCR